MPTDQDLANYPEPKHTSDPNLPTDKGYLLWLMEFYLDDITPCPICGKTWDLEDDSKLTHVLENNKLTIFHFDCAVKGFMVEYEDEPLDL